MVRRSVSELLQNDLAREVRRWVARPFNDLRRELRNAVSYEVEDEGHRYQVEVQILDDQEDVLQVGVSVDDLSLLRTLKPLATSFLIYSDGRIEA